MQVKRSLLSEARKFSTLKGLIAISIIDAMVIAAKTDTEFVGEVTLGHIQILRDGAQYAKLHFSYVAEAWVT